MAFSFDLSILGFFGSLIFPYLRLLLCVKERRNLVSKHLKGLNLVMKNNKAIRSEMRIIEDHLSLWVILHDGKQIGLITARHTNKATIITIKFQDMEADSDMADRRIVEAYEVMTGAGYDRTNDGIASLLLKYRLELQSL